MIKRRLLPFALLIVASGCATESGASLESSGGETHEDTEESPLSYDSRDALRDDDCTEWDESGECVSWEDDGAPPPE